MNSETEIAFNGGFPPTGSFNALEDRLKSALSSLRTQIRRTSNEEFPPKSPAAGVENTERPRSPSLNRTRDLHKLLVLSRTREADLQDEVDSMKSEISDYKYRIKELEAGVDEWRIKLDHESKKRKRENEELSEKLSSLRKHMTDTREKYRDECTRKDETIDALKHDLARLEASSPLRASKSPQPPVQAVDARVAGEMNDFEANDDAGRDVSTISPTSRARVPSTPSISPVRSARPISGFRIRPAINLHSGMIPDISRMFVTARAPPPSLFKLT